MKRLVLSFITLWLASCVVRFSDDLEPPKDAEADTGQDNNAESETLPCGNGLIDDGEECEPPDAQEEPCGRCGHRARSCLADCTWGVWAHCMEEHGDCDPASLVSCTTVCSSTGTGVCTDACAIPAPDACSPPAEQCNGLDDDCDGAPDNGFSCVKGMETPCQTVCETWSSATCSDYCEVPPPQFCPAVVGDACSTIEHCSCVPSILPNCMTELATFGTFPGGYCSATCVIDFDCGDGADCINLGMLHFCLRACVDDYGCRYNEGYTCREVSEGGKAYCLPLSSGP